MTEVVHKVCQMEFRKDICAGSRKGIILKHIAFEKSLL